MCLSSIQHATIPEQRFVTKPCGVAGQTWDNMGHGAWGMGQDSVVVLHACCLLACMLACRLQVLDEYVGGSEEKIRALFADAEEEQASAGDDSMLHIVIFDEVSRCARARVRTCARARVRVCACARVRVCVCMLHC